RDGVQTCALPIYPRGTGLLRRGGGGPRGRWHDRSAMTSSPGNEARESTVRAPTIRASLDILAAASLWGGMYVVSAATFERIPPVTLGFLRLVVGAAALLILFRGRPGLGAAAP